MNVALQISQMPGMQRVPSPRLDLFIKRGFLSPEECGEAIAPIDAQRRPSTVSDDMGDPLFRTSETCDLSSDHPAVAAIEAKITALTGIDPKFGEPLQGQRYAVGQEFKAHTDYFEPHGPNYLRFCATAGQRTWTVMIYLNQPQAGGATRFKTIGKTIQPETGKLLAWNNLDPEGRINPNTLHHGMKVRSGTKYVLTKWFREKPWL